MNIIEQRSRFLKNMDVHLQNIQAVHEGYSVGRLLLEESSEYAIAYVPIEKPFSEREFCQLSADHSIVSVATYPVHPKTDHSRTLESKCWAVYSMAHVKEISVSDPRDTSWYAMSLPKELVNDVQCRVKPVPFSF